MSKLILTLIKMVGSAVWFLLLTIIYLTIVTPIFAILFQEDSIVYVDNTAVMRTLFDAMLGNYNYSVSGEEEKYKHIAFLILHIFISNIFLLNYLIAILATVYEEMNEVPNSAKPTDVEPSPKHKKRKRTVSVRRYKIN